MEIRIVRLENSSDAERVGCWRTAYALILELYTVGTAGYIGSGEYFKRQRSKS